MDEWTEMRMVHRGGEGIERGREEESLVEDSGQQCSRTRTLTGRDLTS